MCMFVLCALLAYPCMHTQSASYAAFDITITSIGLTGKGLVARSLPMQSPAIPHQFTLLVLLPPQGGLPPHPATPMCNLWRPGTAGTLSLAHACLKIPGSLEVQGRSEGQFLKVHV